MYEDNCVVYLPDNFANKINTSLLYLQYGLNGMLGILCNQGRVVQ